MARIFLAALLAIFILTTPCLSQQSSSSEPTLNASEGARRVTGVVVDDSTGKPLTRATVQLQIVFVHFSCFNCQSLTPPSAPKPDPPRETITGADGTFTFDNVPERNISVTATKPGYFDAWNARRHPDEPTSAYSVKELRSPRSRRFAPTDSDRSCGRGHRRRHRASRR